MKWAHRALHAALLIAGVDVPPVPSMQNYFASLYAQFGNAGAGFLPSLSTVTKQNLQGALRVLGRTVAKLGGKLDGGTLGRLAQPGSQCRAAVARHC